MHHQGLKLHPLPTAFDTVSASKLILNQMLTVRDWAPTEDSGWFLDKKPRSPPPCSGASHLFCPLQPHTLTVIQGGNRLQRLTNYHAPTHPLAVLRIFLAPTNRTNEKLDSWPLTKGISWPTHPLAVLRILLAPILTNQPTKKTWIKNIKLKNQRKKSSQRSFQTIIVKFIKQAYDKHTTSTKQYKIWIQPIIYISIITTGAGRPQELTTDGGKIAQWATSAL